MKNFTVIIKKNTKFSSRAIISFTGNTIFFTGNENIHTFASKIAVKYNCIYDCSVAFNNSSNQSNGFVSFRSGPLHEEALEEFLGKYQK
jgi:hypothetical protein